VFGGGDDRCNRGRDGPIMDGACDPFIDRFFERIPREVAETFTPEQLIAVKMAFGARSWGSHAIDIRQSFRFAWWRVYIVFLAGAERRDEERLAAEGRLFGTFGNAAVTVLAFAILLSPVLYLLYELKSLVGFDVFPEGGFHDFFRSVVDQLGHLAG
jgi:hypothetical protein